MLAVGTAAAVATRVLTAEEHVGSEVGEPTDGRRHVAGGLALGSLAGLAIIGMSALLVVHEAGPLRAAVTLAFRTVVIVLARASLLPWLALLILLVLSGCSRRRRLTLVGVGLLLGLGASLYLHPLSNRLLGELLRQMQPTTSSFRYPDDPQVWLGHDLLTAVVLAEDPIGQPIDSAHASFAYRSLLQRLSVLVTWLALGLIASMTIRWTSWAAVMACGLAAIAETLSKDLARTAALGGDDLVATFGATTVAALPVVAMAVVLQARSRAVGPHARLRSRWARSLGFLAFVLGGTVTVGAAGTGVLTRRQSNADPPRVGAVAPAVSVDLVDGGQLNLSDLRGRTVVLAFWATWCAPCQAELPVLDAIAGSSGERAIVVAANVGEARETIVSGAPRLSRRVRLASASSAVQSQYGVTSVPSTFVIDEQGIVRLHLHGWGVGCAQRLREVVPDAPGQ